MKIASHFISIVRTAAGQGQVSQSGAEEVNGIEESKEICQVEVTLPIS